MAPDLTLRLHFTTRLTALPGTTITFTMFLPAVRAQIFGSASAAASMVLATAPAATRTTAASLPLICTGISISSSLAAEIVPQFCRQERRKRRQQQNQILQQFAYHRRRNLARR